MLSIRLQAIADMVTKGNVIADVGSDHGYIPIELVKNKTCPMAYAMDINEGPLNSAMENARLNGVEDKIKFLLSDGMEKLEKGDCESVIIAGMGGDLILRILKESKINDTVSEFIVSPHTKQWLVREYLLNNGFDIVDEKILIDAGKYYQIIKAKKCQGIINDYYPYELMYGRILINRKDKILYEYLTKQLENCNKILEKNNVDEIIKNKKNIELALEKY